MPIYAYKCESCGFAKDVLQKMSDAPLETCPACEESSFKKQVTAAGFQLKGSGWYATDFKGGGAAVPAPATGGGASGATAESGTPAAAVPDAAKAASVDATPAKPAASATNNT